MRKLYDERTNLIVQDIKEQPEDKYVAIVASLGEKSAISFERFTSVNGVVILFGSLPKDAGLAQQKDGGPIVASFPVESEWTIVKRDRFIEMSGKEYSEYQVKEAKKQKEMAEIAYGKDGMMLVTFPNGKQVMLPVSEEIKKKADAIEEGDEVKATGMDSGGYL